MSGKFENLKINILKIRFTNKIYKKDLQIRFTNKNTKNNISRYNNYYLSNYLNIETFYSYNIMIHCLT